MAASSTACMVNRTELVGTMASVNTMELADKTGFCGSMMESFPCRSTGCESSRTVQWDTGRRTKADDGAWSIRDGGDGDGSCGIRCGERRGWVR